MFITAQRFKWQPLQSIAFGSLSNSYAVIGSGFTNPVRILKVVNTSDIDVLISSDGITDMDIVPAGGFFLYDITLNKTERNVAFLLDQGTLLYARYASGSPSEGAVYVVGIYAASE